MKRKPQVKSGALCKVLPQQMDWMKIIQVVEASKIKVYKTHTFRTDSNIDNSYIYNFCPKLKTSIIILS